MLCTWSISGFIKTVVEIVQALFNTSKIKQISFLTFKVNKLLEFRANFEMVNCKCTFKITQVKIAFMPSPGNDNPEALLSSHWVICYLISLLLFVFGRYVSFSLITLRGS